MQRPTVFLISIDDGDYNEVLHQTRLDLIISEDVLKQQMKHENWGGSLESFAESGIQPTPNFQVSLTDDHKTENEVAKATDRETADFNAACTRLNVLGYEGVIYVRRKGIIGKIADWIEDIRRGLNDPSGKYAYD